MGSSRSARSPRARRGTSRGSLSGDGVRGGGAPSVAWVLLHLGRPIELREAHPQHQVSVLEVVHRAQAGRASEGQTGVGRSAAALRCSGCAADRDCCAAKNPAWRHVRRAAEGDDVFSSSVTRGSMRPSKLEDLMHSCRRRGFARLILTRSSGRKTLP